MFTPIYMDGAASFNAGIVKEVLARVPKGCEYIISSRLDNDDALHCQYIQSVQEVFAQQGLCYIDCRKGFSLEHGSRIRIASISKKLNPFASLIEKVSPTLSTIATREHTSWSKVSESIVLDEKPLWIQVVHGNNLSNRFGHRGYLVEGGYLIYDYDKIERDFGIPELASRATNKLSTTFYNLWLFFALLAKSFRS